MAAILVIGASRGIGLETVKRALEGRHSVRAFARSATDIAIDHPGLERCPGDATQTADVVHALQDMDAVVLALGLPHSLGALLRPTTLFSSATRVVVDAMQTHGPRRLVCVTGLGAGNSRGHGGLLYDTLFFPLVLKRAYDDKDIQEMMIRRSSLDWTIVRPGILTDGPMTGQWRALLDTSMWRADRVSRADVADFIVREIEQGTYSGQTPVLLG